MTTEPAVPFVARRSAPPPGVGLGGAAAVVLGLLALLIAFVTSAGAAAPLLIERELRQSSEAARRLTDTDRRADYDAIVEREGRGRSARLVPTVVRRFHEEAFARLDWNEAFAGTGYRTLSLVWKFRLAAGIALGIGALGLMVRSRRGTTIVLFGATVSALGAAAEAAIVHHRLPAWAYETSRDLAAVRTEFRESLGFADSAEFNDPIVLTSDRNPSMKALAAALFSRARPDTSYRAVAIVGLVLAVVGPALLVFLIDGLWARSTRDTRTAA